MLCGAVHCFCGAKSCPIIGVGHIGGAGTSFSQTVPIDPLYIPAFSIIVANRIAADDRSRDRVAGGVVSLPLVSNLLPIVRGE